MDIPYGRSNFEEIRRRGYFYVDKTPYLPILERGSMGYPLLLRPRRFGKSTFLSLLETYYDIGKRDQFDELFHGLWIAEHPTPERNSYLILTLDFSNVSTDSGGEGLRRSFFESVRSNVQAFLLGYRERVSALGEVQDRLDKYQDPEALLGAVMAVVSKAPHKIYLLIDEYDHFANRLLSAEGAALYDDAIVRRTGFVRTFYAGIKVGTRTGAIGRMFITGVTPLMLDDLSSGFNIATHVSRHPDLNAVAGFTRADVERAVDALFSTRPDLAQVPEIGDRARLLDVMERYYDGYRFSEDAKERVFNSDMVLYLWGALVERGRYPANMLDRNVRTEVRHLQRIGALTGTLAAERREVLEGILSGGRIRTDLIEQFGVKSLASRAPYLSLLYHLGMLTFTGSPRGAEGYELEIPNRVIRELHWEHLAHLLQEQSHLAIDTDALQAALAAMASRGDIAPFLELFHSQVLGRLGVKDTRGLDERTLKLLFMMYVSLGRAFHALSEKEFAQGYCDLFLGPARNVADARFSWLLELKHLPTNAKPAQIEAAFAEARAQVERYASDADLLPLLLDNRELKAGMLVFLGAKRILFRPWPEVQGVELSTGTPVKRPTTAKRPRTTPAPPAGKRRR